MTRFAFPGALFAAVLSSPPRAFADAGADGRQAADALYEEAGRLMDQGRFAEACPKLEASHKLDPAIGTLLRLGHCHLNRGRTASALAAFQRAERLASEGHDWRAEKAREQIRLLTPKLSHLLLHVEPEDRAAGVEIQRNGSTVGPGLWGLTIPVDPGEQTIEAAAPGRLGWRTTIVVDGRSGTTTVHVPALAPEPRLVTPPPAPAPWSTWEKVSLGLGVGGLGAGVIVGTAALIALRTDTTTKVAAAGTAFGLGCGALGAGLTLFYTSPARDRGAPALRVQAGPTVAGNAQGIAVRGEW